MKDQPEQTKHTHHSHGHGHSHDHSHLHTGRAESSSAKHVRRLGWTLGLVLVYMFAEIIGGLLSNSLALLADAGHMLSDAASLALALFAIWIGRRPPNDTKTYGYYRAEILAALANAITLVLVSLYIFYEAFKRFNAPAEVQGTLMMSVAVGGLIINLIGLWLLHSGKSESLNVHGAWLHVLGDMLGSVGAIVAGILIWAFGWAWADPLASVIIAVLVLWSAWHLLKSTLSVLMEAAPPHIDVDQVRETLKNIDGITGVHDLHIWTITSGMIALSAHVDVDNLDGYSTLMHRIHDALETQYGIQHTTVQVEPTDFTHQHQCF